ncbi:MAG TPA: hypothetical protein VH144_03385 [Candidatus Saccharimonadales bacterium]|jgi:hypothetical protein|nr:hypothetical protein [Candidatus Saccharimonadales bacterium]
MKPILQRWLPLAFILSVAIGAIYIVAQQVIRQSYNWPQINAANEISDSLHRSKSIDSLLAHYTAPTSIDVSDSTFVIIYDVAGNVVKSGAKLGDNTPVIVKDVLFNADEAPAYHAVTWAPQPDVRIAAVVQKVNVGDTVRYVLAGRNLSQPEHLTEYLLLLCSFGWAVGVFGSLMLITIIEPKRRARL